MKKKIEKPVSDYFRKLAKKSWKVRKAKMVGQAKPISKNKEN